MSISQTDSRRNKDTNPSLRTEKLGRNGPLAMGKREGSILGLGFCAKVVETSRSWDRTLRLEHEAPYSLSAQQGEGDGTVLRGDE